MPVENTELRISLRKLLAGLVLIILPVSLAGLYVTSRSEGLLEQSLGGQFKASAEIDGAFVAQFMSDSVLDCQAIASDPEVRNAILASDKSGGEDARVKRMEGAWNNKADAAVVALENSPAANVLKRRRQADARFLLIIAAGENGATVAATDKPATYVQSAEPYWDQVYAQGKGSIAVRDVQYDAASRATYAGIAVPVLDETHSRFAGAVYALIDLSPLLNRLSGPPQQATLVKSDGTIISAPGVGLSMNLKAEEFAAVQDAMSTPEGRRAGYAIASVRNGGRKLVGFADLGIRRDVPHLDWLVMVSQDLSQATSPLRDISRFAMLMVIFGLLLLTLVAMYFFTHRKEEFEEIHELHEKESQA